MLHLAVQVLTILVKQHVQMSLIFATSGMSPQVLQCNTDDPGAGAPLDLNIPEAVALFGRRYVASDSSTALHYYMLAADLAGGGVIEQGRLFRELLVQSKDYGEEWRE
jgi:hypothetical protein